MASCTSSSSSKPHTNPFLAEGWFEYNCFGRPIKGTRIIPIKTPLNKKFNNGLLKKDSPMYTSAVRYKGGVPQEDEFTPAQCVERLEEKFGRKLFAVVDLTYTFRYYESWEFSGLGVKHAKIKCPGREVPSETIYAEFTSVLSRFLKESSDSDSLVAVHCTHGVNRTGYLVCRFLIERQKFDAETAIKEFNEARGYDIERDNYLQHLRDGCPQTPVNSRPTIRSPRTPEYSSTHWRHEDYIAHPYEQGHSNHSRHLGMNHPDDGVYFRHCHYDGRHNDPRRYMNDWDYHYPHPGPPHHNHHTGDFDRYEMDGYHHYQQQHIENPDHYAYHRGPPFRPHSHGYSSRSPQR